MSNNVLVSVYKHGYLVKVDGVVEHSRVYSSRKGTDRDNILRGLSDALVIARNRCDHGVLVVELDNSFIHKRISEGEGPHNTEYTRRLNHIYNLIEVCDAKVKYLLVPLTNAETYAKGTVTDVGVPEYESVLSSFNSLED